MLVEYAGRQGMECELSILVDNGVSRIASALKADYNIRLLCQAVRNLSFAFIAPVCSYDCSDQFIFLLNCNLSLRTQNVCIGCKYRLYDPV